MIVVDASQRASLEDVARHEWLQQGQTEEPAEDSNNLGTPLELPEEEMQMILLRMEEGGYGSTADILKYANERIPVSIDALCMIMYMTDVLLTYMYMYCVHVHVWSKG